MFSFESLGCALEVWRGRLVMARRVAAVQGTADHLSLLAVKHPLSAFDPMLEAVLE